MASPQAPIRVYPFWGKSPFAMLATDHRLARPLTGTRTDTRALIACPTLWVQPCEERLMKRSMIAIALIACSLVATACNTVEGAGQDMQSAGEAVSDAAK